MSFVIKALNISGLCTHRVWGEKIFKFLKKKRNEKRFWNTIYLDKCCFWFLEVIYLRNEEI